ncbi:UvrD-helicase domain-containing protein [Holospora curviuscula]|uniref:DNA 3'-5' helicase n=1 Tax=Holospora curviuscula TaxID=1082868 RepID=A0A2S5R909_9PROT|nr:UvrD-helicase domain-containing protein [Holospora curviuscula]PPE03615.1 ATP-dependent helicase/nuclease subunit A [Holospora curviuscula]
MLTQAQYSAINPHHHVWVHASAGTGKTFVLTYRLLRLLLEGVRPERIVALTFTQHAGKEMMQRLYSLLEDIMCSQEQCKEILETCIGHAPNLDQIQRAQKLWSQILDTSLNIQTLHSFCQTILHTFPLEAGLPGTFKILDEHQGLTVWYQQQERVFSVFYPASLEVQSALRRLAARYTLNQITLHLKALWHRASDVIFPTQHSRPPQASPPPVLCPNRLAQLIEYLGPQYSVKLKGLNFSWDHPHYQAFFLTQQGMPRKKLLPNKVPSYLKEWLEEAQKNLWCTLRHERHFSAWQDTQDFCQIFSEIYHHYTQYKKERGLLDFSDLLHKTIDLLQNPHYMGWVYSQLDQKIHHVLVDEAQDTSPAQWKILSLLSEIWNTHPQKTFFVVGDPKQCIYGFQGADLDQFYKTKKHFQACLEQNGISFYSVHLTHSFRSYSCILNVINEVFRTDHAMDFKPHTAPSHRQGGLVELLPLLEPPAGKSSGTFIAHMWVQRIQNWISQEIVLQCTGRSIKKEDILILVSKRCSLYEAFSRALSSKKLWIRETSKKSLKDTLLVQDILALIRWLLAPQDDWSLVHLFKSPLFGVSEADLLAVEIFHRNKKSLWEHLESRKIEPWSTYVETLAQWKKVFFQTTPFQFMHWWIYTPWLRARYTAWPNAMAILDKILALLFNFCQEQGKGWSQWIEMLSLDTLTFKHSTEKGVGLLTIHSAKGLESPVVIIPDLSMDVRGKDSFVYTPEGPWKLNVLTDNEDPWYKHYARRQDEEHRRILYVAMTRAQERLYCSSLKDSQPYQDIHSALLKLGVSVQWDLDIGTTKGKRVLRYG